MSAGPRVTLRPCRETDGEFLVQVFQAIRAEEFAVTGWSPTLLATFLRDQSRLQETHYHAAYPEGSFDVVEVDGVPAGRQYVDRSGPAIHLIDLALLPEYQRRGFGTRLMSRLLREAETQGRVVDLQVELANPARRLYQRLGFLEGEFQGIHVAMRCSPGPKGASHA